MGTVVLRRKGVSKLNKVKLVADCYSSSQLSVRRVFRASMHKVNEITVMFLVKRSFSNYNMLYARNRNNIGIGMTIKGEERHILDFSFEIFDFDSATT